MEPRPPSDVAQHVNAEDQARLQCEESGLGFRVEGVGFRGWSLGLRL